MADVKDFVTTGWVLNGEPVYDEERKQWAIPVRLEMSWNIELTTVTINPSSHDGLLTFKDLNNGSLTAAKNETHSDTTMVNANT